MYAFYFVSIIKHVPHLWVSVAVAGPEFLVHKSTDPVQDDGRPELGSMFRRRVFSVAGIMFILLPGDLKYQDKVMAHI
jgi:hypothetical protein